MDEKILRYAKECVAFEHRKGYYPGGVSKSDWPGILKDCKKYVELAERDYGPEDYRQRSIDNYKMECIEYRLSKYVASARSWGKLK